MIIDTTKSQVEKYVQRDRQVCDAIQFVEHMWTELGIANYKAAKSVPQKPSLRKALMGGVEADGTTHKPICSRITQNKQGNIVDCLTLPGTSKAVEALLIRQELHLVICSYLYHNAIMP